MEELDDIEKSVLIVNDVKTVLLRDFKNIPIQFQNDAYIMGYGHGFKDAMDVIKNIINKY